MTTPEWDYGNMDIYLFDQIQKGRFIPGSRILDAGCGTGRNLMYFLQNSFEVYGVDSNPKNMDHVRRIAEKWAPADHFRVEGIENLSFPANYFDAVICNAVLHFAHSEDHFLQLVNGLWERLKPGGLWFARLASTIGIEKEIIPLGGGRYLLPDGTERFLVDAHRLIQLTDQLQGSFIEPIKSVLVHEQRTMTNWVLRKTRT
ncbi:bifunctional 2-polyprenyl-6-hydroxyphenol methylase/3-demethylubiquinol 3-O-methyltransferase UbiG [Ammoniphilus sp. CFH 90114]|uniref:class I SAM-dependent methyltransferase n=1 Tax=Ammoniphilus sp. CFH 90114 TaxID=2493665 RepID=UPI00100E410C|nr:class I SAM-dependent methyltransferase [Ammoniphilus sp. CFH 90114]RXT02291.1 class I SAM-dependent methyltransferase [Ammoniphilus sp. CFH 90114]